MADKIKAAPTTPVRALGHGARPATITLIADVLPPIAVLPVDAYLHAAAQSAYRASLPSGTSLVDQVSLAVLEREGITAVPALDADLAGPGVNLYPSP